MPRLSRARIDLRAVSLTNIGEQFARRRRVNQVLARKLPGELTAVWVPDPGHEAMRDLVRARLDAVRALRRARQQLSGFLLRQGRHYGRPAWTKLHRRWLAGLKFEQAVHHIVLEDYIAAVEAAEARRDRLTAASLRGELYPRVGFIVTNLARPAERVVAFYNHRGTCEQYIKEGKGAIKWTRLSCRSFAANAVRLQLHALAYNLGNFMRTLAMPKTAEPWSLTSLREKLIKIGAKVVSHGRYVTFQMAEVAVPRQMFAEILSLIARLQAPPAPA